jgi:hypothetical protein
VIAANAGNPSTMPNLREVSALRYGQAGLDEQAALRYAARRLDHPVLMAA